MGIGREDTKIEFAMKYLEKNPDARRRFYIFCFGTNLELFDEFYGDLTGNEILNLITEHPEFANSIVEEIEQEVEKSSYKLTDEQLEEAGRNVWNKLQKKIQTLE